MNQKLNTQEFLSHFPNHHFQLYWDQGTDPTKGQSYSELDTELFLKRNLDENLAICFSVNGFKDRRKIENLISLNAGFNDYDVTKPEEELTVKEIKAKKRTAWEGLVRLPIKPNIISVSSNGLHPYWLLEDTPVTPENVATYSRMIKGIIEWAKGKASKGDNVKDLTRVFRVPGFYHVKAKPFLVEAFLIHNRKAKLSDLAKLFPYVDMVEIENDFAATSYFDHPANDIDIQEVVLRAYRAFGEPSARFDEAGRIWLSRGVTGGFIGKNDKGDYIASTSGHDDTPSGNKTTFVRRLLKLPDNRAAFDWICKEFNISQKKQPTIQPKDIDLPQFDVNKLVDNILNPEERLSFGYKGFDGVFGGLQPEFTYLIAAKSGNCKSALSLNILHNLATKGIPSAYFDLENGQGLGDRRLLQIHTGWDKQTLSLFEQSKLDKAILEKMAEKVKALPLYVFYGNHKIFEEGMSHKNIILAIRKVVQEKDIRVVCIDNLRNLEITEENENRFLSKVLTDFDQLANDLKISILLVHHTTIKAEEKGLKKQDFTDPSSQQLIIPPISKVLGTSDLVNKVKGAFTIALDAYEQKLYVWVQKNRDGESDKRFALNISLSNLCISDPPNWKNPLSLNVVESMSREEIEEVFKKEDIKKEAK